jgi:predicted alpha/beta hydrolase
LAKLTLPVISFSFEGDFFAPSGAAQHLVGKMKNAKVTHVHMQPKKYGLKNKFHFSWAKKPDFIVSLIVKWMKSQIVDVQHNEG